MNKMKNKLKSKVVWITLIPLIANVIAVFSLELSEQFTAISTSVVSALAVFGILNNPDSKDSF